jgi:hypothetical protein
MMGQFSTSRNGFRRRTGLIYSTFRACDYDFCAPSSLMSVFACLSEVGEDGDGGVASSGGDEADVEKALGLPGTSEYGGV